MSDHDTPPSSLTRDPVGSWYVYMLRCADDTLYTGVATDVQRRLREHNSDTRLAAKYTRSRRPLELVYTERSADRSAACRREFAIKCLPRRAKQALIASAAGDFPLVIEK